MTTTDQGAQQPTNDEPLTDQQWEQDFRRWSKGRPEERVVRLLDAERARAEAAEANVARIQNDMVTWLNEANLILQADDEVRRILYNRDRFGQPLPDQSRADGGVR